MTRRVAGAVIALVVSTGAVAQTVSGQAFDDRNGNGRRDAGEPAIAGVAVEVYGTRDVGGAFDQTSATAADGSFALAPGNGCYLMRAADPAGWRGSFARFDMSIDTAPGYTFPIGYPRFAKSDQGIDALKTGNYALWRETPLAEIEQAGHNELLNWYCLAGAMNELNRKPQEARFIESWTCNSDKVFAVWRP